MTLREFAKKLQERVEQSGNGRPAIRPHCGGGLELVEPYKDSRVIAVVKSMGEHYDMYRVGRVSRFCIAFCTQGYTPAVQVWSDHDGIEDACRHIVGNAYGWH